MTTNQPTIPKRDQDGFLVNLSSWDPAIAELIAAEEKIILTSAHWEVIGLLRQFYAEYQMAPSTRTLVNALQEKTKNSAINSIYLHQLFPPSPAIQANKIAGLPKPVRCI